MNFNPITSADINEYLDQSDDFDFELQVARIFSDSKIRCQHNGTYADPVTGKYREYDIRAFHKINNIGILFTVECKNISDIKPLIISCVRRKPQESFHKLIKWEPVSKDSDDSFTFLQYSQKTIKTISKSDLYPSEEFTGKSMNQISKNQNKLIGSDAEIFSKFSQAISSGIQWESENSDVNVSASLKCEYFIFIPVVVIPNNKLWVVEYNNMNRAEPKTVDQCTYFIRHQFREPKKVVSVHKNGPQIDRTYNASHLHFFTVDGLTNFISYMVSKPLLFKDMILPPESLEHA